MIGVMMMSPPSAPIWLEVCADTDTHAATRAAVTTKTEWRTPHLPDDKGRPPHPDAPWQAVKAPASIRLTEPVPAVRDCEAPVRSRVDPDPIRWTPMRRRRARTYTTRNGQDRHRFGLLVDVVGNKQTWNSVLLPTQPREMQLPEVFKARSGVQGHHRTGVATLARAVVHDGHARLEPVDEWDRVRRPETVVPHDEQIHRANWVLWADQLELLVHGQVSRVQSAELSE